MAHQQGKRGRRPQLTAHIQDTIVTAISGGVPFRTACAMAGVSDGVASEWRKRGEGTHPTRPKTPLYAEFAEAIARARATDEARRILRINQAAQGGAVVYEKTTTYEDGRVVREVRRSEPSWQADAFHLERSRPETWGRREKVDVRMTIEQAAQKVAEEFGMTPEEVLAEAERLLHA